MCKNIVVIPQTLNRELQAVKFPYGKLLNVDALLSILSVKDVAFFIYCQSLFADKGPEAMTRTLNRVDWQMNEQAWSGKHSGLTSDRIWAEVNNYRVMNDTQSLRPAYDGLFSTESGGNNADDFIYDFQEVNEDTIAVVLTPINKEKPAREQMQRSVDKFLAVLSKYFPIGELAKTNAFRAFIELSVPVASNS